MGRPVAGRQGLPITAIQQVLDNRRCIRLSGIGLDICKSRPAETAKHEMDIRIKGWGDGRMFHDVRSRTRGAEQSGVRLNEGQRKDLGSGGPA